MELNGIEQNKMKQIKELILIFWIFYARTKKTSYPSLFHPI